jgi:hypothetical protein
MSRTALSNVAYLYLVGWAFRRLPSTDRALKVPPSKAICTRASGRRGNSPRAASLLSSNGGKHGSSISSMLKLRIVCRRLAYRAGCCTR